MTEIFAFDTTDMDADDGFELYRNFYVSGAQVQRLGSPFFARGRSWRLDRTLLFARDYGGVRHFRSERAERDGSDHFVLHHVVSGELMGGPFGQPMAIGAGETLVLDTREPMESAAASVQLVTVSLARDALRAAMGCLEHLHGHRIGRREGSLLASLLRELVLQAGHLLPGAHAAVTRTLVELLSVAIHPAGAVGRSDVYRLEHQRRDAARRLIEANLGKPNFSVQDILDATGMSRASLYRLFESQGGVARYIQKCRLQQLRSRLDDRAFDGLALAELAPALGFSGESHAGRLFKQAFGVSPGVYRAASIRGAQSSSVQTMVHRWDCGLLELG